jgi:hypothetical protein
MVCAAAAGYGHYAPMRPPADHLIMGATVIAGETVHIFNLVS